MDPGEEGQVREWLVEHYDGDGFKVMETAQRREVAEFLADLQDSGVDAAASAAMWWLHSMIEGPTSVTLLRSRWASQLEGVVLYHRLASRPQEVQAHHFGRTPLFPGGIVVEWNRGHPRVPGQTDGGERLDRRWIAQYIDNWPSLDAREQHRLARFLGDLRGTDEGPRTLAWMQNAGNTTPFMLLRNTRTAAIEGSVVLYRGAANGPQTMQVHYFGPEPLFPGSVVVHWNQALPDPYDPVGERLSPEGPEPGRV